MRKCPPLYYSVIFHFFIIRIYGVHFPSDKKGPLNINKKHVSRNGWWRHVWIRKLNNCISVVQQRQNSGLISASLVIVKSLLCWIESCLKCWLSTANTKQFLNRLNENMLDRSCTRICVLQWRRLPSFGGNPVILSQLPVQWGFPWDSTTGRKCAI